MLRNFDNRVPTLLLTKNPGLSETSMKNFPGPFRSPQMLSYKEKRRSKCSIIAEISARCKMWTLAVQNSDEIVHTWSLKPLEKCMTFKDIFHDFPAPKWFSMTFQVLEFSRKKNPVLSRRRGNRVNIFGNLRKREPLHAHSQTYRQISKRKIR